MDWFIRLVKGEPAMVLAVPQAALALAVTLGLHLTTGQTGALEAVAAGIVAIITAAATRPVPVPVLTGGLTAIFTCLVAFGVPHVTPPTVSALNVALLAVLAIVLRAHQTPVAQLPAAVPVAAAHP